MKKDTIIRSLVGTALSVGAAVALVYGVNLQRWSLIGMALVMLVFALMVCYSIEDEE